MKKIILKSLILIPALIFINFLVMTIIGCTACFLGFDQTYYGNTYCNIFKALTLISIISYFIILYIDIKTEYQNSLSL
jgi:energy-coupling factor transporter transmembrane protein EcfT